MGCLARVRLQASRRRAGSKGKRHAMRVGLATVAASHFRRRNRLSLGAPWRSLQSGARRWQPPAAANDPDNGLPQAAAWAPEPPALRPSSPRVLASFLHSLHTVQAAPTRCSRRRAKHNASQKVGAPQAIRELVCQRALCARGWQWVFHRWPPSAGRRAAINSGLAYAVPKG